MAERRVSFEFVQRERIVDTSADSPSIEGLLDRIASGHPNDIKVMNTAVGVTGAIDPLNAVQRRIVMGSHPPPGGVPLIEPAQLHPQDGGLQRVEPAVEANLLVTIFQARATIAQQLDAFGDIAALSGYQPAIAIGAQVLPGVKAKAADVAQAPRPPAGIDCAVRLCRVFDHYQRIFCSDGAYRRHVRAIAVEMNRNDRLGAGSDGSLDLGGVDQCILGAHIDQHWARARQRYGESSGGKGHRRDDHFVALSQIHGAAGEVQRVGSAGHSDSVRNTAIVRELFFEQAYFSAEYKVAAIGDTGDHRVDLSRNGRALCLEIDERDGRREYADIVHGIKQSCFLNPAGITDLPASVSAPASRARSKERL